MKWRFLSPCAPAILTLITGFGPILRAQEVTEINPPESAPPAAGAPSSQPSSRPRLSPLTVQPEWRKLEAYSGILTREEFLTAVKDIYTDGTNLPPPWKLDGDAVLINTSDGQPPVRIRFRSKEDSHKNAARFWRTPAELPRLQPGEPILKGLHISIDPGHIGGPYAQVEERWLSMRDGEAVMEGQLVLQVAQILKPRLEALGAQVSLVRSELAPVTTATPEGLYSIAKKVLEEAGITNPQEGYIDRFDESRILSVQWQAEKLFYRVSEIRARAEKVNKNLKPDIVLCLHLNAESWGDPRKPEFVKANHLHLLVNGCYSPEELSLEDVRYEMMQRLFSRTHLEEVALADSLAPAMAMATQLPHYTYNRNNARRVSESPYVYARNLLANRLYECPVIYFEPYVMNEEQTYRRLLLGHYIGRTLLGEELVSSPLEDYARGVIAGLVKHYASTRPLPKTN